MPTDDAIRASDRDRERTIAILREAYALGRLTLPEFDERTTAALAGRTWGDLRALTRDLPGPAPPPGSDGARVPAAVPARAARPARPASERARLVPVLVIALFWLAVSLWAHAGGALIPVVFLLLIAMHSAGSRHCGPGGPRPRSPRPGWRGPSQPSGGQADGPAEDRPRR